MMLKKKEQIVRANYVVFWLLQNAHPYFEWNRLLDTPANFFSKNQMKTLRQENGGF